MVIELEGFHTTWCTQSMYASAVRAFEMGFVGLKEKKRFNESLTIPSIDVNNSLL